MATATMAMMTVNAHCDSGVDGAAPPAVGAGAGAGAELLALRAAFEPAVESLGYELVHLEWASAGGGRALRVTIDAPGGIRVDDCEAVSRRLDALPAADGAWRQAAHLEVSSPGLDRPLVTPAHFRRFTGHRARIVLRESDADGRRRFCGALVEAGERGVLLEVDGARIALAYRDMATARVEPAF